MMRRMLLLAGALLVLPACEEGATDPDVDDLTGASYTLVKFNDQTLPVEATIGVCTENGIPTVAEQIRVESGTVVFKAESIMKVDLDIMFRCGTEGDWEPSDEGNTELRYEKAGDSLVLSEKYDASSDWREIGTAALTASGIVVIVQVGDNETDLMKLEFKKD